MNFSFRAVGVACTSLLLGGCLPYMQTVQDAYRTDPVLVQYQRMRNGTECYNPIRKWDQESKLAETLCPIDLDVYRFPADDERLRSVPKEKREALGAEIPTAYTLLQHCQKSAASLRYVADALAASRAAEDGRDKAQAAASEGEKQLEGAAGRVRDLSIEMSQDEAEAKKLTTKQKRSAAENKRLAELRAKSKTDEKKIASLQKAAAAAAAAAEPTRVALATANATVARTNRNYNNLRGTVVAAPSGTVDPETCRVLRNFLQDEIITRSVQMCKKHLADATATASLINTDLGLLSLVSSTLGAVVGGIQAKTNLAGLAAGSSAAQTLINKEIYRDYVVPAIIKKIESDRSTKLALILADQSKDVGDYSVSRSIVDANEYHERCSFAHGLMLLAEDNEKRTPPRVEELEAQIKKNLAQIVEAEGSISDKTTEREKEILQKSNERLRLENDALLVRINMLKRVQGLN